MKGRDLKAVQYEARDAERQARQRHSSWAPCYLLEVMQADESKFMLRQQTNAALLPYCHRMRKQLHIDSGKTTQPDMTAMRVLRRQSVT